MKSFKPFYGEIVGKNDLDFLNEGNREAIVQTHNTITNNSGGIVNGLTVSISPDKSTVIVGPGVFYTAGSYSPTNNSGGGERGDLFIQQSFRALPATPPIGTIPQYLLVYAKIVNSDSDPNPLNSQAVPTSKNLQTGENVPVRQYPKAIIVVTNPGFRSSLLSVQGVHLALIQVDWVGTNQVSSNNSVQTVDVSIRKNYTIGNALDVNAQEILDSGIPDSLLTNRMYSNDSITGEKFADGAVITQKIHVWDEQTAYNSLGGSGVANQHLKDDAVTSNKINYELGLNEFGNRNRIFNSSFEIFSGSSTTDPESWDLSKALGTNIYITTYATDSSSPKYGNNGLFMLGGIDGSSNALALSITQTVDFQGELKNLPISAFFWAKEISPTNFAFSGTTGLRGKIEFLDNNTVSPSVLLSQEFGLVSGVSNSDYIQYTTDSHVIYSGTTSCKRIRYTLGGNFNGSYYVDGLWLGVSNLVPGFDINPSEYITVDGLSSSLLIGQIQNTQIADGAITTIKIRNADGSISTDTGNGVTTAQIRDNAIVTSKIADGTVTAAKLAPGTGLMPQGAVILWDQTSVCPSGYVEAIEYRGFFPLGMNPSTPIGNAGIDSDTIGGAVRATDERGGSLAIDAVGDHAHGLPGGDVGGGGTSRAFPGATQGAGTHAHTGKPLIPFRTVVFCRKT